VSRRAEEGVKAASALLCGGRACGPGDGAPGSAAAPRDTHRDWPAPARAETSSSLSLRGRPSESRGAGGLRIRVGWAAGKP
jgi:hypothetical protein